MKPIDSGPEGQAARPGPSRGERKEALVMTERPAMFARMGRSAQLIVLFLDLGHIGLGFDPKNEIVRVYAYLGEEQTSAKNWLAAELTSRSN